MEPVKLQLDIVTFKSRERRLTDCPHEDDVAERLTPLRERFVKAVRFAIHERSGLVNIEPGELRSSPVKLDRFPSSHGTVPANPAVDRFRSFKFFKRPISLGIGRLLKLLKLTSKRSKAVKLKSAAGRKTPLKLQLANPTQRHGRSGWLSQETPSHWQQLLRETFQEAKRAVGPCKPLFKAKRDCISSFKQPSTWQEMDNKMQETTTQELNM